MITLAPLPRFAFIRPQSEDDAALMSPWLKVMDTGLLAARSAWSLAAVAKAVARRRGRPARVLLPAWICNQSLWPLRQTEAELVFLPVRPDGGMDWSAAQALDDIDLVVVVHTFGHAAELREARDFATSRGALMVEDAAHALMPSEGIHDSGDVILYSPHKLLAQPEGAVLVVRPRAEDWTDEIATALGQAEPGPDQWRWLARRVVQRLIPQDLAAFVPLGGQTEFLSDPATQAMEPPAGPSELTRALMARHDLADEANRRWANDAALRALVMGARDLRPLFAASTAIPYRTALRAASPQAAAKCYGALRAARLAVESWPDLPPEVMNDPRHADGAVALRRSVLLLPVHGALSPGQLTRAYGKVLR